MSPRRLAIASLAVGAALAGCGGGDDGGDGAPASGDAVFADAGCGDCHTFSPAESTAQVGSNLDDTKLSPAAIEGIVRSGTEGMPPYEGRLSDEEIVSVAEYVAGGG